MNFGTFRPLSIFTWRPSVSDAHSTRRRIDEQTRNTNTDTQAVTSSESATRSTALTTPVMFADPLLSGRRAGQSYKRRSAPKRYVVSLPNWCNHGTMTPNA
jgi:hypothetical protein